MIQSAQPTQVCYCTSAHKAVHYTYTDCNCGSLFMLDHAFLLQTALTAADADVPGFVTDVKPETEELQT